MKQKPVCQQEWMRFYSKIYNFVRNAQNYSKISCILHEIIKIRRFAP